MIRGWQQRRCGVAAPRRLIRSSQIIEDMTVLLCERGHHRHHRIHQPGALGALGPNAPLAPEGPWPNGPLGGVVRGLHPVVTHKRPQGLPSLEHLPTDPCRLWDATGLPLFEPPLHLAPDRPHRAGNACMGQRAVADAMPPVKHLASLVSQGLADRLGSSPALDHGFNIPHQMSPAELAPPGRIPAGPTPAVRDQPPPEPFSQECLRDLATARPPHHKDRHPGRDRRPQPRAVLPFTPSGLLQRRHRWLWDSAPGRRHRRRHCLSRRLLQVRQGAQTHRPPKQILQDALGGAFGQMVRSRAQGRDRLHTWATCPRGQSRRPLAPAQLSTGRADHAMPLIRGDHRLGRWDLGDVRPLGLGIVPPQGLLAAPAPCWLDRDDDIDLLNRPQRPRPPRMTGLPTRSTPTGLAARAFPDRRRRIARRRPRGGA